jgi:hypothetical protein
VSTNEYDFPHAPVYDAKLAGFQLTGDTHADLTLFGQLAPVGPHDELDQVLELLLVVGKGSSLLAWLKIGTTEIKERKREEKKMYS